MQDSFGAAFGRLIKRKRAETKTTQGQLACALYPNLDAEEAEKRKGDISKLETGKVANPATTTIKRLSDALGITDEEIDALQHRAQMSPKDQLENISALTRDQLELLASRFEIETPHTLSEGQLQQLLTQKAKEYRSYRTIIENIDPRIEATHNLKAAAQHAAEKLDFDEVETLLSRVAEVEAEIFSSTQEARAQNALLRNRPDQAFQIFTAAAESFRDIDVDQMAIRRNSYFKDLYNHGLRYGGTGLPRAIEIIRPAIDALQNTQNQRDWAAYTQNLANALVDQGIRTDGPDGTALLAEAVTAYRDALTVRTKVDHPVDWATTTQNLATALQEQGIRTDGPDGTALLAEAVTAYRDALTVLTKVDHPVYWAGTTQNLAAVLRNQGTRTDGPDGTALLAEAVTAYRDALTVLTKVDHPVHWAGTTQNLAAVLRNQGSRTDGPDGTALLAEAVTAYRDALTVRTKVDHPVQWATTTQNLATALSNQGIRTDGPDGTALLAEAVTAFRDALTVRTKADHPVDWATTMKNLALAEEAIADHDATDAPLPHLHEALSHVEDALTVLDPEHTSYDHASATRTRDRILAEIAALDG